MTENAEFPVRTGVDFYCVVGNPIAHSLSPEIHQAFAAQLGEAMDYARVAVPIDGFKTALRAFVAAGGRGMNVTVPFKELAFDACDQCSVRARRARAVNTISVRADGQCHGDNTDGEGLVRDLVTNLGVVLEGQSVLLIGAGGAARGVIAPLFEAGIRELILLNRSPERAAALRTDFPEFNIVSGALGHEPKGASAIVINATAGGLDGQRPDIHSHWIDGQSLCYDMVYGPSAAPFLAWAADCGAGRCADGLGMLVEQAAAAFRLWRGKSPETRSVLSMLRKRLDAGNT